MNYTFSTRTGDGETKVFDFSFAGQDKGYINNSDIQVTVDGIKVPFIIYQSDPNKVHLQDAPKKGSTVLIRRVLSKTIPYSDFKSGNAFSKDTLNNSFLKQLYITQEVLDGYLPEGTYYKQDLDMGKFKVINLGDPVSDTDAVNKKVTDKLESRVYNVETAMEGVASYTSPWRYMAEGGEAFISPPYRFKSAVLFINGLAISIEDYRIEENVVYLHRELVKGDEVYMLIGSGMAAPDWVHSVEVVQSDVNRLANEARLSAVAADLSKLGASVHESGALEAEKRTQLLAGSFEEHLGVLTPLGNAVESVTGTTVVYKGSVVSKLLGFTSLNRGCFHAAADKATETVFMGSAPELSPTLTHNMTFGFTNSNINLRGSFVELRRVLRSTADPLTADVAMYVHGYVDATDVHIRSDIRDKTDIRRMSNSLDAVEKLAGYLYTIEGRDSGGVIAQELEKVVPELVVTAETSSGEERKRVNYTGVIGLLIEAVKELSIKVKDLEEKQYGCDTSLGGFVSKG